jgi:hypothetical protein
MVASPRDSTPGRVKKSLDTVDLNMSASPLSGDVWVAGRLINTPDWISERPPRGGLSVLRVRSTLLGRADELIESGRRFAAVHRLGALVKTVVH